MTVCQNQHQHRPSRTHDAKRHADASSKRTPLHDGIDVTCDHGCRRACAPDRCDRRNFPTRTAQRLRQAPAIPTRPQAYARLILGADNLCRHPRYKSHYRKSRHRTISPGCITRPALQLRSPKAIRQEAHRGPAPGTARLVVCPLNLPHAPTRRQWTMHSEQRGAPLVRRSGWRQLCKHPTRTSKLMNWMANTAQPIARYRSSFSHPARIRV